MDNNEPYFIAEVNSSNNGNIEIQVGIDDVVPDGLLFAISFALFVLFLSLPN